MKLKACFFLAHRALSVISSSVYPFYVGTRPIDFCFQFKSFLAKRCISQAEKRFCSQYVAYPSSFLTDKKSHERCSMKIRFFRFADNIFRHRIQTLQTLIDGFDNSQYMKISCGGSCPPGRASS